jgi:phosphatidylglycerol lysyltransferase
MQCWSSRKEREFDKTGTMRHKSLQSISSIISVCLFAAAILLIHHELRNYHLHDIIRQVRHVPFSGLLAAAALTVLNYVVLTASDALALKYVGHPLAYRRLALASSIGHAFSNSATFFGGGAARYRIYSALGLSAGEIGQLILFCSLTFWLGFFLVTGTVFVFAPQHVYLPQKLPLPLPSAWIVGVACLVLVGVYILSVTLRRRPFQIRGWELPVPSPTLSIGQIGVTSFDWLLAAGVLYVLLPPDTHVAFTRFLGIFMVGQGIGMVSHVPGGLGVFETVVLVSLSNDGNAAGLTAALVLYRLIYYILPLILGSALLALHELLPQMPSVRRIGLHLGKWGPVLAPQVFAFAVFVSGAILLFSGALPPVRERFDILRDLLPLPAIEMSHFLGSLTGAMLLLLARGLQRRLDGAYHIALLLLGAGIVFSVLKGLDYEEAIILGIMLAALLPCRSQFYRRTSLTTQRFSPGWTTLIIIVLLCSLWLGMFAYKHVEYSHDLWWKFTFRGDAPRFLRATTGAIALVGLYAGGRLLVPVRPRPAALAQATAAQIRAIVRASPRTYANLALLGDKQFVFSDSQDAFIMYAVAGRSWIAMGDPVGPPQRWDELTWKFIELCDRYDGQPAFYQVDAQNIDLYANLGLTFLKLGEEARVPLAAFSLEGNRRKGLRHTCNRFSRHHYSFRVVPAEEVAGLLDQLRHVSDAWLSAKNTREKRFSLGFFHPDYIASGPVAVVYNSRKMLAFANLWLGTAQEESSVDLMRYLPDCPDGMMDYLFTELMRWSRQEGYQWFNLGMAPLSGLEDHALAPLWSKAGGLIFRHGEHFYNFQGLRRYKEKFEPQWSPKYLACRGGLALPRLLTNIASLISGGLAGIVKK